MSEESGSYTALMSQSVELANKAEALRREEIESIKQRIADMKITAEELGFPAPKKKSGIESTTRRRPRKVPGGGDDKGAQPPGDGASSGLQ